VGQFPVTRPDILTLLNGRRKMPRSRPFAFFLVAYPATAEYVRGWCRADRMKRTGCPRPNDHCPYRERCPLAHPIRPIAPFEADLTKLNHLRWVDLWTGKPLHVIHGLDPERAEPRAGRLVGRRILDVLRLHRDHADPRYVVPAESLVSVRRDVLITGVRYITKEMHHLEEALGGLWILEEVTYELHPVLNERAVEDLRAALHLWPSGVIAEETRRLGVPLSERAIKSIRNRHSIPHLVHQRLLWQVVDRLRERSNGAAEAASAESEPGQERTRWEGFSTRLLYEGSLRSFSMRVPREIPKARIGRLLREKQGDCLPKCLRRAQWIFETSWAPRKVLCEALKRGFSATR